MQCKWLQIFCLCAAIQFQFTVGYPNGDANLGDTSTQYGDLINTTKGKLDNVKQSPNTDTNSDIESTTKTVTETTGFSKDGEYDTPSQGNPGITTVQPQLENMEANSSNRDPKMFQGSSPTRHICTKSTKYYNCQIRNVHLKKNQSYIFGLQHNPQQDLTFQDSTLEYLPKSLIDGFPFLTLLNLNDLMITSIEPNAFESAASLRTMYLENNRLINVERHAFRGAKKLQMLVLSKNEIVLFDYHAFDSNTDLQRLYLDQNQLDALPSFANNAQLQFLNASHNNLASINDTHFRNQRNLKTLDVSFNRLKRLDLQQLDAYLELVDVSSNALTDFIMPTYVTYLNAKKNSLTEFAVGKLCTLVELNLAQNKLGTQPELENCNSLEILDLSYNLLEAFKIRASMSKLQILKLGHNNLFEINVPIKLQKTPLSLKALDLSYNKLSHGPPLSAFQKLQTVLLNDNYLISLKSYADKSHTNFRGYRIANNEWSCAEIPKFQDWTQDKDNDYCKPGMKNESGICCRVYSKPYNDRLNQIVREADFHERAYKKKCSKPVSTIGNPINLDEIHNAIATANTVNANKLNEIKEAKIQTYNKETQLKKIQADLNRLHSSKSNVALEIERQRQSHRVTREGLITEQEMLERIIKFVQEKGKFNDELLLRRKADTEESHRLFGEKQKEIEELEKAIAQLQKDHTNLKTEEKGKKKKKEELQRKVNKNSASIHGSTGQISQ